MLKSRGTDSTIEAVLSGNMTVVDTDEPATVSIAPADATLVDQHREPSPDIGILGICSDGGVLTDQLRTIQTDSPSIEAING
ncbi:hypothetical protein BZM27_28430 [Paraburkholderia steynii]|uniref:Uncharacterized protein n=1 Tax=Paraburkholderia steynii TaxID=1245441 RepID=A0A4V2NGT5_9BURK|nr:hypothetical protein BZM27_28430 [Paraburkholderia steynii]